MTLIIGLPNSGKTTYSEKFRNVIHFDDVPHTFPEDWFSNCNKMASEAEGDVCVEGVYNDRNNRILLLDAVKNKGGKNVCIWIDTSVEECLRREQNGRRRPPEIVTKHANTFEPPTLDEGWDEVIVING